MEVSLCKSWDSLIAYIYSLQYNITTPTTTIKEKIKSACRGQKLRFPIINLTHRQQYLTANLAMVCISSYVLDICVVVLST